MEARSGDLRRAWPGRGRVRLGARAPRPHSPARLELRRPSFTRHVQLSACHDRRRGAHAARLREPDPDRSRAPASFVAPPRHDVDLGSMDDGAHRWLRRCTNRDGRAARWRHLAALWHQVVYLGDDRRHGTHPSETRGQSSGRPRLGDVLPRASGRQRAAASRTSSERASCQRRSSPWTVSWRFR